MFLLWFVRGAHRATFRFCFSCMIKFSGNIQYDAATAVEEVEWVTVRGEWVGGWWWEEERWRDVWFH